MSRHRIEGRIADRMEAEGAWWSWRRWVSLPFEAWPELALLDFLDGTPFAGAMGDEPSAAELRAIIAEAIGPCVVVPDGQGGEQVH